MGEEKIEDKRLR